MKRALLSVSDKTDLEKLARFLLDRDFCLVSTGGTYRLLANTFKMAQKQQKIIKITSLTHFPEILDGRVKTLHPNIYGGLLARNDNPQHQQELQDWGIMPFDLVCVNLYPFHQAVERHLGLDQTQELIDIGGVSLLRAAAKNFQDVIVLSQVSDYQPFMSAYAMNDDLDLEMRKKMAVSAYQSTSNYDLTIQNYLDQMHLNSHDSHNDNHNNNNHNNNNNDGVLENQKRSYVQDTTLKYGCNPHQQPAHLWCIGNGNNPFQILNGSPGYINLLDAINAWQLVSEAKDVLGGVTLTYDEEIDKWDRQNSWAFVASFKHTSPAGVAMRKTLAEAYRTARDSDPMSSFGDFVALSEPCDLDTAKLIKREVSDGIVAPGYTPEALELLKGKKKGRYLILQADPNYRNPQQVEYREMFGMALSQPVNNHVVGHDVFRENGKVVTQNSEIPIDKRQDLLLANLTMKYAQSNNVVLAYQGQVVAVAAGQQSRVDCVKLACRKLGIWYGRQHPKVLALADKYRTDIGLKRNDKVNCAVRYVEGDFTEIEYADWCRKFKEGEIPEPLTEAEKKEHLATLTGVCMASDAFFPFRDSIDHASKVGVSYIIQPGGSIADQGVIEACDQYEMAMVCTGVRVFTH